MKRRTFLGQSMMQIGGLGGLGLARSGSAYAGAGGQADPAVEDQGSTAPVGRPVRIVSIGFLYPSQKAGHEVADNSRPLQEVADMVDKEASKGSDLVVLPETWRGYDAKHAESLDGPTITLMSTLAKKHKTYIVCPIERSDGPLNFNSAVLLDRKGQVACVYNKLFPVPWSETNVRPGKGVAVCQTDFGRLGMAICFDAMFPEVWKGLAEHGAELVVWASAGYSAVNRLQAYATLHNYYIVTATHTPDCYVYDITGERVYSSKGQDINISHVTVDLDRCICFYDRNMESLKKLLAEHPNDVMREKQPALEDLDHCFVLRARRPGVSARGLAREYGLIEQQAYIASCRQDANQLRGSVFS